eukprot:gene12905-biopygen3918
METPCSEQCVRTPNDTERTQKAFISHFPTVPLSKLFHIDSVPTAAAAAVPATPSARWDRGGSLTDRRREGSRGGQGPQAGHANGELESGLPGRTCGEDVRRRARAPAGILRQLLFRSRVRSRNPPRDALKDTAGSLRAPRDLRGKPSEMPAAGTRSPGDLTVPTTAAIAAAPAAAPTGAAITGRCASARVP